MNAPVGPPSLHPSLVRVLQAVRKSPLLPICRVFGSMARGAPTPRDLDLLVILPEPEAGPHDLIGSPYYPELSHLLAIGRNWYGFLDPFVLDGRKLWVRDDKSSWYIPSRLRPHIRAILASSVPFEEVRRHYLGQEGAPT